MEKFDFEELREGVSQLESMRSKLNKVVEKLKVGTPQNTLAERRIKALTIALTLMKEKYEKNNV